MMGEGVLDTRPSLALRTLPLLRMKLGGRFVVTVRERGRAGCSSTAIASPVADGSVKDEVLA